MGLSLQFKKQVLNPLADSSYVDEAHLTASSLASEIFTTLFWVDVYHAEMRTALYISDDKALELLQETAANPNQPVAQQKLQAIAEHLTPEARQLVEEKVAPYQDLATVVTALMDEAAKIQQV